ncbi:helix-turn-helix transcriptional regulator [Fibrella sp. HMF5335]|uniref:Helix-turn-helix transcriptional regulator n=1 Tax=Fibrella rubiginis TaxID=2817060 RepID=A0A939GG66_9BACT|nr:helix-turn-helix transcriptional regulator [Fibrella rubiginis]MBO0936890.1 helix-turn-helix transcriptional regulator [Fibrella rubiginis]
MKLLNTPNHAGERIRIARLQRGLSQENMADLLGLSTTAYGDIERGKTELTVSRLTQIAGLLDTTVIRLLSDETAPVEPTIRQPDEVERLRETIDTQQLQIDKLRLEVDYYKRRYDERIAMEMARAMGQKQERSPIGF